MDGQILNAGIVVAYLVSMLLFGWWGKSRTKNNSDYLVAGRRLGGVLYTGTMAAVVLGGASTVGGVGLGYKFGLSGMWLVVAIGTGVLVLSLFFAPTLQRLKIYTVAQMLTLRYGVSATKVSGIVMLAYTLMLCATSTGAYATILVVLFGWERWVAIAVGGAIVLIYSTIGGMWSITLADMAQFVIKTIGVFALMLPFTWNQAGGLQGVRDRVDASFFDINGIGAQTIITYFVVYTLGLLIGQDIWQRVFTARTPKVARWGGTTAGVYCILYGVAGALIGMAASVVLPNIEVKDDVYADVAMNILPIGVGGIVLAAAVAAMMSTASGTLIAAATVAKADVVPFVRSWFGKPAHHGHLDTPEHDVQGSRWYVLGLGVVAIVLAILVQDVVAALTIAYDILVGGLLIAIIGGLVWKRGTGLGAAASMAAGTVVTLTTMIVLEVNAKNQYDGIYANEPIYYGLIAALVAYVAVSLLSRPTDPETMGAWNRRVAGAITEEVPVEGPEDVHAR
jgi:solute:Na+ symporter, SSS family